MNGLIKALVIGGGGYLAWQSGILTSITGGLIPAPLTPGTPAVGSSSTAPTTPTNPTSPSPANPTAPSPAPAASALALQQTYGGLVAAATAGKNAGDSAVTLSNGVLYATPEVWTWYLQNRVNGNAAVPNLWPSTQGPIASTAYWAGVSSQLTGISGLGILALRPRRSGFGGVFNSGGMGGFQPAASSYCGPVDPVSGMRPPVDSMNPSPGSCNTGMGRLNRWIY